MGLAIFQPKSYRRIRQHGTRSRYTAGCRCSNCRAANAAYGREYRNRPPTILPRLTTVMLHAACGQAHVVLIEPRPFFKTNGALHSYIGVTQCGRFTFHVYRREL